MMKAEWFDCQIPEIKTFFVIFFSFNPDTMNLKSRPSTFATENFLGARCSLKIYNNNQTYLLDFSRIEYLYFCGLDECLQGSVPFQKNNQFFFHQLHYFAGHIDTIVRNV